MNVKKMFERLKRDDGFTLVELLIASAVLAVIMVPLMRAFVIAANTTGSAMAHGKVTVAMENTAELIATSSFGSIDELTPADSSNPSSVEKSLSTLTGYNGGSVTVRDFGLATDYTRTGITADMITNSNSVGYTVEGADIADGTGLVDVIITPIDAGATSGELAFNDMYDNVNASDYSSFTAMDKTWLQTGIGLDTVSGSSVVTILEDMHIDYIAASYLETSKSWSEEELKKVQRTINITISDSVGVTGAPSVPNDANGDPYKMVYYKVDYEYRGDGAASLNAATYSNTLWEGFAFLGTDNIFSVQLVYLPLYGTTTDKIIINNVDNIDCKFFLIKQSMIDSTFATTGNVGVVDSYHAFDQTSKVSIADDTNYSLDITLNETSTAVDASGDPVHSLRLFTNVYEHVFDGQTAPDSTKFTFQYNSSPSTSLQEKLVDDSSGGRGYNILVRVYEKDGANYVLRSELKTVKLM